MATAPGAELTLRIGVDVVGVGRLEKLVRGHEQSQETLFTQRELDYCLGKRRCYEHMAARFAAKEAVMKAMGVGLWKFKLRDVEVVRAKSGAPSVALHGRAAEMAAERGIAAWHLSLTHTETTALAVAIAMGRG